MPITFHDIDALPDTVAVVLAQHPHGIVVLLNYTLIELMSPVERLDLLNALFATMDAPPAGGRLHEFDELAAPRRRRTQDNYRQTQFGAPQGTQLERLNYGPNSESDVGGEDVGGE